MTRVLPWIVVVAVVGCASYVVWRADGEIDGAMLEAARESDAEVLRQRGLVVAERRTREHLEAEVERLTSGNAELAAELERARRVMPRSRPVAVASASTGPLQVLPAPGEMGAHWECERPPACLLAAGDTAEIRVDEVVLGSQAGNRVLVGSAAAWRLQPEPTTRLVSGAFSAPVTSYEIAPDPEHGWAPWVTFAAAGAGLALGIVAGAAIAR